MKEIVSKSFSINLKIMHILRLYPPDKNNGLYKIQAHTVYFIFVVLLPVLIVANILQNENADNLKLNYTIMFLIETVAFITKLMPFINNSDQIRKTSQQKIIEDCIRICRRNSIVWVTGIAVGTFCSNIQPLLQESYKFPIYIWLPFNATATEEVYYTTYFFTSMAVAYNAFSGSIVDPLIGGLAYLAAGQMMVLRNKLQFLQEYVEDDCANSPTVKKSGTIYTKITDCINHHNAILTFVKEYEKSFSLAVFSQFAASMISIGMCCLSFSMAKTTLDAFSSLVYILILLGQIFFYCYYGTFLFEENKNLADGVYMSKWYLYDSKSKRALIILMERSQRPLILTGGKIIKLTLETFAATLKTSYSVLTLLKSYQ